MPRLTKTQQERLAKAGAFCEEEFDAVMVVGLAKDRGGALWFSADNQHVEQLLELAKRELEKLRKRL